jgi:membrane protein YdbS with pleckstrin-like domain
MADRNFSWAIQALWMLAMAVASATSAFYALKTNDIPWAVGMGVLCAVCTVAVVALLVTRGR